MSGSVAEALLASGSKKLPLLPPPPKLKKDPKTFQFDLELAESNEKTYPEFSWTELVKGATQTELTKKVESGAPTLNPYASDDEDDLKAMAAKFEAKYNTVSATKKKKRRVEDYIDRGAGYDETDPFIDNSDVYDEVVPADLQTVHGGFYINSGSLDFKEVELSEDEEDSLSQTPKVPKIKKAKTKIGTGMLPKQKNPVGRPPGGGTKRPLTLDKNLVLIKKRKIITNSIGPDGKIIKLAKAKINSSKVLNRPDSAPGKPVNQKPKVARISSSSESSSSSSSEGSSSSSDSESSSGEETEEKKETPRIKTTALVKVKPATTSSVMPKPISNVLRQSDIIPTPVQSGQMQPKRLKTKNVPLNPKLHPNLNAAMSTASASSFKSMNITSQQQMQSKIFTKDLMKTNGGSTVNISPRSHTQSSAGIMSIPTSSPSLKVPPPKLVSTPTASPGLSISTVNPPMSKGSNNMPTKPKMKNKPATNSINVSPNTHLDIFNSLAASASAYTLPNLSNFGPNLTPNSSLLKGGLSLVTPPKAMPNLKKMTQPSSADRLVQKPQKAATPKPVKKPKHTSNTLVTPPTSHSSAFNNSGSGSTYLSNLTSYKTPPPLAGPGVEISKVRTSSVISSGVSSTSNKGLSNATSFSPSALGLATVSLAHTSSSNSIINASINSIINSTSSLVNNVPSSLTVQRLPQSITITPTTQQSIYPIGGMAATSNKALDTANTKVTKHISAYDVSALLQQNPVAVSYASTLLGMGNSKSGAGKSTNNLANNREVQRK